MSNLNETCAGLIVLLSATSLGHAAMHTYKFDKWRCLLPKRKEWFRVLLTWMLIGTNLSLFIWGLGWSIVKYNLGWIVVPEIGAIPVPPEYFPPKYKGFNLPLSIMLNVGYSLQASLNAEEGLYWFHLMRAVKQPKSARNWLNSYYFYAWIAISIICTVAQCSVGWIGTHGNENEQISRELVCGGAVEMLIIICASIVLARFPAFLKDVKASGASPEVRSRLHFYHEANKVRTFLRFIFAGGILSIGVDGCSKQPVISLRAEISDPLIQVALGSFFLVLMISMILYLPRSYSSASRSNNVMVGPQRTQPLAARQLASGHALMSLLREGGQWDDDDDLRACTTQMEDPPYALPKTWSLGSKTREEDWNVDIENRPELPAILQNFSSPIAVQVNTTTTPGPVRIRVEKEIHRGD